MGRKLPICLITSRWWLTPRLGESPTKGKVVKYYWNSGLVALYKSNTFTFISVYSQIHTYLLTQIHVFLASSIHPFIHTHIFLYTSIHTYRSMCVYIHVFVYTHAMWTNIHTCTLTYKYIIIHVSLHTLNSAYNENKYGEILLHYRQFFVKSNIITDEWGIFVVEIFLHYSQFFVKGNFVIGRVESIYSHIDTHKNRLMHAYLHT